MKASMKKWVATSRARIRDGLLGEGEIRVMRLRMSRAFNRRPMDTEERDAMALLIDAVQEHGPRVTAEQARKGADWLYNKCFTPTGTERTTAFVRENFNDADLQVIRELRDAPRFELVSFDDVGRNGWHAFVPIYRAHGKASSFDYAVMVWQSGGASFIVEHAAA